MKILITGGTGFLGKPLVKRLLEGDDRAMLRVVARNEGKLIELKEEFPQIEILAGDCADKCFIQRAMDNVHAVYHLSAFKHVGLAENQPTQCIKSNVTATQNICELSLKTKPVFIIAISTDKAAQVSGVYGATKFLTEYILKDYQGMNKVTKYRIVRYGNVLYSTGSVLTKWKKLIEEGKPVKITDPLATRFFWTIDQAIDLIFECLSTSTSCTPYVPDMKAMQMGKLLTAMCKKYAKGQDIQFETIGLQPGENLHEKIFEDGPYSNEVEQYSIEEIMELI